MDDGLASHVDNGYFAAGGTDAELSAHSFTPSSCTGKSVAAGPLVASSCRALSVGQPG